MRKNAKRIIAAAGLLALAACQSGPLSGSGSQARAQLESKSNSSVKGQVSFTERGNNKVLVSVRASGLKPNSAHGFHVHEKGDCSAPDATSAGGHFNPDNHPHNHPSQASRHAGDMPNLTADAKGEVNTSFEIDTVKLDTGRHGIINRAVVIHAEPDDYRTQPTGNSGGRIACGLIAKA